MRMIFLLVVLLIIALLLTRQIGGTSTLAEPTSAQANQSPHVPTRPQGVQQFGQDMDKFVQDSAARRKQQIDKQTR